MDDVAQAIDSSGAREDMLLERALHETNDAIQVLLGEGLHPGATSRLEAATQSIRSAKSTSNPRTRARYAQEAMANQSDSRDQLAEM